MSALSVEVLAASQLLVGIALPMVGLVITGALIWAFWLGSRVRDRESAPPRPEEQPRLPDDGAVHEIHESREPEEVPRSRRRLTPHRLKGFGNIGTRRSASQRRKRWSPGSSGSFGSGGPGGKG